MDKKIRILLLTALTTIAFLSLAMGPVFADEVSTPVATDPILVTSDNGSTDPVAPDATAGETKDPGYVEGSEGTGVPADGTDVTAPDEGTAVPIDKTVDGTVNTADDGIRTLGGTDTSGSTDQTADDPRVEAYQTLGMSKGTTTSWPLLAGVGVFGLLIGFGIGFLVRRPRKVVPTV